MNSSIVERAIKTLPSVYVQSPSPRSMTETSETELVDMREAHMQTMIGDMRREINTILSVQLGESKTLKTTEKQSNTPNQEEIDRLRTRGLALKEANKRLQQKLNAPSPSIVITDTGTVDSITVSDVVSPNRSNLSKQKDKLLVDFENAFNSIEMEMASSPKSKSAMKRLNNKIKRMKQKETQKKEINTGPTKQKSTGIQAMRKELVSLRADNKIRETTNKLLHQKMNEMQQDWKSKVVTLEAVVDDIQSKSRNQSQSYDQETEKKLETALAEKADLAQMVKALKLETQTLRIRIENTEDESAAILSRHGDVHTEILNLRKTVISQKKAIEKMTEENGKLLSQIEEGEHKSAVLRGEKSDTRAEISKLRDKLGTKEGIISKLRNENDIMQHRIKEVEHQIAEVVDKRENTDTKMNRLTRKLKATEGIIKKLSKENGNMKTQVKDSEDQMEEIQEQRDNAEARIVKLTKKVKAKESIIKKITDEKQDMEIEIDRMSNVQSDNAKLKEKLMAKRTDADELDEENETLKSRLEESEQEISELHEHCNSYQLENQKLTATLLADQKMKKSGQIKIRDLEAQIETIQKEKDGLVLAQTKAMRKNVKTRQSDQTKMRVLKAQLESIEAKQRVESEAKLQVAAERKQVEMKINDFLAVALQHQQKLDQAQDAVSKLTKMVSQCRGMVSMVKVNHTAFKKTIGEERGKMIDDQVKVGEQVEILRRKLAKIEGERDEFNDLLRRTLSEKRLEVDKLTKSISEKDKSILAFQSTIEKLQSANNKLKADGEQSRKKLENRIESLSIQVALNDVDKNTKKEQEKDADETNEMSIFDDSNMLRLTIRMQGEKIKSLAEECDRLTQSQVTKRKEMREQSPRSHDTSLWGMTRPTTPPRDDYHSQQSIIGQLQLKFERTERDYRQLKELLMKKQQDINKLKAEVENSSNSKRNIYEMSKAQVSAQHQKHVSIIMELKEKLKEQTTKSEKRQVALKQNEEELRTAAHRLRELKRLQTQMESEHEKETKGLEKDIRRLLDDIDTKEMALERMRGQVERLEEEMKSQRGQSGHCGLRLGEVLRELQGLQQQVNQSAFQKAELQAECDRKQQMMDRLKSKLESKEVEFDFVLRQSQKIRSDYKSLQKQLQSELQKKNQLFYKINGVVNRRPSTRKLTENMDWIHVNHQVDNFNHADILKFNDNRNVKRSTLIGNMDHIHPDDIHNNFIARLKGEVRENVQNLRQNIKSDEGSAELVKAHHSEEEAKSPLWFLGSMS